MRRTNEGQQIAERKKERTESLAHFVDVVGHGQRDADENEAGEDHERGDDHHGLLDPFLFQILFFTRRQRQRLPGRPEVTRRPAGSGQRFRVDEHAARPYDARRRGADLRTTFIGVTSRSPEVVEGRCSWR